MIHSDFLSKLLQIFPILPYQSMRLSNGTTTLFVAASFLATTVSRSQAQEQLAVTDLDAVLKYEAKKEDADTGILLISPTVPSAASDSIILAKSSSSSTAARSLQLPTTMMLPTSVAPQCTAGIVDCDYGMVRGSPTTTCAAACGPTGCCVGVNACSSFTGKLCKDGSCNGKYACTYASIPSVRNSCKGDYACYNTGYDGTVGNISSSCNAIDACCYLGTYGATGHVQDSCNAYQACDSVAYKGFVGKLTSSCKSASACKGARSPTNGTGTIPYDLLNCCNDGDSICIEANKDTLPTECWSDTKVRSRRKCCRVMQSSCFFQLFLLYPRSSSCFNMLNKPRRPPPPHRF